MSNDLYFGVQAVEEKIESFQDTSKQIQKSFSRWSDRLKESRLKYGTLRNTVIEQKGRISISPQIRGAMEAIQLLEHKKTLGQFEELLEAILEDILPDRQFKVRLDLSVSHKIPSLEFYVATHGSDQWENAWKHNGGAVADALSLGLRVISILRSGQRPFMLLDEADAWTEEDSIPRYTKVLHQLCIDFGLQVVMITHHTDLLLETAQDVPVYRLTADTDGAVQVNLEPGKEYPSWNDDDKGIRGIKIENVLSHEDTFIPFNKGLTVILGKNNVGKSVIGNALTAIARGDSDESLIRHYKDECKITLEIEDHLFLECRRTRKSEKGYKVFYYLKNNKGDTLKSTNGGTEAPDWLNERLNMNITEEMDGLDPFLLTQKDRTFLLNRPKTKRAQVLSISMGEDVLQSMFKLENQKISELNAEVKSGEKLLHYFHRTVELLGKYEHVLENHVFFDKLEQLSKDMKEIKAMYELYETWASLEKKRVVYDKYQETLEGNIVLAESVSTNFENFKEQVDLIKRWTLSAKKSKIYTKNNISFEEFSTPDTKGLETMEAQLKVCHQWSSTIKKDKLFGNYLKSDKEIIEPNLLLSENDLNSYIKWVECVVIDKKTTEDLANEDITLKKIEDEQAEIKTCPLCDTPLEHGLNGGHHHD